MSTKHRKVNVNPQQAELLVYGYTRILAKYWNIRVPNSIQLLCLVLYSSMDKWNTTLSQKLLQGFEFDLNENLLTLITNNTGNWLNAFGTDIIKKGMKKTWQFIVPKRKLPGNIPSSFVTLNAAIIIGIIDIKKLEHQSDNEYLFKSNFTEESGGYGYYSSDGGRYGEFSQYQGRKYGKKWSHGNVITMQLDMTGNQYQLDYTGNQYAVLEYWVDGIHQGFAFYEIDLEERYVMGVSMLYSGEQLQMVQVPDFGDMAFMP